MLVNLLIGILAVLGALVLLAAAVLGFIALRFWLAFRSLRKLGMVPAMLGQLPATIELEPADEQQPDPAAQAQIGDLRRHGFADVGTFTINEVPGLVVHALADSAGKRLAAVYGTGSACWADIVALTADGIELTVSSAKTGGELDVPPWTEKRFLPGATVDALVAGLAAQVAGRTLARLDGARFVPMFQESYARTTAWRALRGGPTLEETRRIAIAGNLPTDDASLAQAMESGRNQALAQIDELCRRSFKRSASMSPDAWEEMEHRLLIVHGLLTGAELSARVVAGEDQAPITFAAGDLRAAFRAWNQARPETERHRLAGSVAEPLPADLWIMPEDD